MSFLHFLYRWRFVTHGCVDGYSRMITFVSVATNNKATTVRASFDIAVEEFGLPSRIRIDYGGENSLVAKRMEMERGAGRGSVIRGRSVHNIRVERMWLELWNNTVNVFYDLFMQFERDNILNPNSEEQMFALQYVFLPRISLSLLNFKMQWNHHKVRTEKGSPVQLFVQRSLELQGSAHTAIREIFNREHVDEDVINEDSHSESGDEDNRQVTIVNVPETLKPLGDEQIIELQTIVNPNVNINLSDKAQGLEQYFKVLDFISEKIAGN
jgi:hypothetical protein